MSVQSSQIPDLLKIGAVPSNTAQDVETAVLEPVVHSDTFCRFVFQNKGILHSHSKIEIGLKNLASGAIFPVGVGVYSLIERVALKMGTKTICEIEDFGHWYAYKSMFVANENNKERELYQNARAMSHQPHYEDARLNAGPTAGGGESNTLSAFTELDWGRDYNDYRHSTAVAKVDSTMVLNEQDWMNLSQRKFDKRTQVALQARDDDTPLFQMSLSELCPFLKMNQLPLYMIKEQVSLELTFSKKGKDADSDSSRRITQIALSDQTTAGLPTAEIDTTKTRLIADYLYFPQEMMEAYAQSNANMSFTYVDYQLSKYSVDKDAIKSQAIRNIGGAGRIVSKLFWGVQDEFQEAEYLLNNYYSQGPSRTYTETPATDSNGNATFNIKYNDNFLYPIDVDNSARHFYNVQNTEGLVPFVNREEYCGEGDQTTTRSAVGWVQGGNGATSGTQAVRANHPNFVSKFFWSGARLNKNQRINSRGIELYFKVNELPTKITRNDGATDFVSPGYIQRVYMEVVRTATLSNGYFQCYYA